MSKDVNLTNRFWAAMAEVAPNLFPDKHGLRGGGETMDGTSPDLPRAGIHQIMWAVVSQIIDRDRILLSADDDIVFGLDGQVIITERPEALR